MLLHRVTQKRRSHELAWPPSTKWAPEKKKLRSSESTFDSSELALPTCVQHAQGLLRTLNIPYPPFDKRRPSGWCHKNADLFECNVGSKVVFRRNLPISWIKLPKAGIPEMNANSEIKQPHSWIARRLQWAYHPFIILKLMKSLKVST